MPDVTAPFGFPYPEDTDLVRDGASDIEALAEGVNDQLALGFQFVGTRYYTSSGTFAKADPFGDSSFDGAKLRAIRVRMVGGGGGGGATQATVGGQMAASQGGSAGSFAESFITDIAGLATSVTVTRGAGGAQKATGAGDGNPGGDSSFDALVVAAGGKAGAAGIIFVNGRAINAAAAPAGANTGDIVIVGGTGSPGILLTSDAIGGNVSCSGGNSQLGTGGKAITTGSASAGPVGNLFGGGAAGSIALNFQSAQVGAAGGDGIVIVDVFA